MGAFPYFGSDSPDEILGQIMVVEVSERTNGNIDAVPLFVDAEGGDYHLTAGSPCIDAGTDVGLTLDIEGVPVPQGAEPDIGAFEFVYPNDPPVADARRDTVAAPHAAP